MTVMRGKTTAASNNGSFAPTRHDETDPAVLGLEVSPWSGKEPADVDTALAGLYRERSKVRSDIDRAATSIYYTVGARQVGYGRDRRWNIPWPDAKAKAEELAATNTTYVGRDARRSLDELAAAKDAAEKLQSRIEECDAEFVSRGGWTRAFLVVTTGSGGHVHSSMGCSTCNKMGQETDFVWLPDYSGRDEDEIVSDAGERACTVCYPSAPVDVLARPTRIFSDDERKAAQARDERARAAAERKAKQAAAALTPDGSEFVVETSAEGSWGVRREHFKTEKAATQRAVGHSVDRGWYYTNPHEQLEADLKVRDSAVDKIVAAVAAKHGRTVEDVRSEFQSKAVAKAKRDGWL